MQKEIYVMIDRDGDIVEYYPSICVIDEMFQYKRYREKLHGPLKVYKAKVELGEEVKD